MDNNSILLTETNLLDVYKKLTNQIDIDAEELEQVKKRFWELVSY